VAGHLVHGASEAGARAAHQTGSGGWDAELVPDDAGRTTRPEPDCPVEIALDAVRGRWTTLLLRDLLHGPRSFGDLRAGLPDISDKVLAERLAGLRARGLVERLEQRGFPTRGSYRLTPAGESLRPLLVELYEAGRRLRAHRAPGPA
jgi:DNA-binding HxlR family transcriptional regulator